MCRFRGNTGMADLKAAAAILFAINCNVVNFCHNWLQCQIVPFRWAFRGLGLSRLLMRQLVSLVYLRQVAPDVESVDVSAICTCALAGKIFVHLQCCQNGAVLLAERVLDHHTSQSQPCTSGLNNPPSLSLVLTSTK